jgi:hypothetical protein
MAASEAKFSPLLLHPHFSSRMGYKEKHCLEHHITFASRVTKIFSPSTAGFDVSKTAF